MNNACTLLQLCYLFLLVHLILPTKSSDPPESDIKIISRFQQYLQIDTAQPNPNYSEAASFILSHAKSLNLESQTLEYSKGKPVILLKWLGKDPNLPSILLNSHIDVVPAEHHKWNHPPFLAHMDESGDIYARGSQDMKCVGLQYLEAIRGLKTSGFEPVRTVFVSFVPDEEIGGLAGAQKFSEPETFSKMNVGIVLDEGLASPNETYRVFYSERRTWRLVIKATGALGHGSKLYDNSAMGNLFKSVESVRSFRASQFDLVKAGLKAEGEVISVNMAGTPSPTGFVMNLQPSEAEAGFDIRLPPGADTESLEKRIVEEWAPSSRNMSFELRRFRNKVGNSGKPVLTDSDKCSPWWMLLEQQAVKKTGHARYFRELGLPAIGFSPMANTPILLHDHNEFLNQAEYLKGIEIYKSIIKSYASYFEQPRDDISREEL